MKKLLFIDTNIYLDFYRVRNEVRMAFLDHIDSVKNRVIMTYQVEMEFKKNRQSVIAETIKNLKTPSIIPRPGLLSNDRTYSALSKGMKEASKRVVILQNRLQRVFEKPETHDPIYKLLQRISKKQDSITLHRGTIASKNARRLALKRFLLGYPPRKRSDLSTGDAVNWEWLIECAISEKPDEILVVSRDADYGICINGVSYLNDWLKQEFKERAGRKPKIKLYTQLALALKEMGVPVTKLEQKSEKQLMARKVSNQLEDNEPNFIKRISLLAKDEAMNEIELAISDVTYELIDEEPVSNAIADTNTFAWEIDDYNIESFQINDDHISATVNFSCSGEQDEDKMFHGNHIDGKATALIDENGDVAFEEIFARLQDLSE